MKVKRAQQGQPQHNHCTEHMDLSLLKALEREKVLEVLQRDKVLRSVEEERIRKLKLELQEIRRKGAKSFSRQYSERTCARCQRPLGKFWNCGAICHGCSHRICSKCRVSTTAQEWKCTVCHAYREVKIKSGEWFVEERAKKFPGEPEISKSQNDMSVDPALLTADYCKMSVKDRRSMSDTAINWTSKLVKAPSLPNLFKKKKNDDEVEGHNGVTASDEDTSSGTGHSGEKRNSLSSLCTEYGIFTSTAVSGEIEFALIYSFRTSSLEITVRQCRNLAYGDPKRNKCHPYVKVYLLPEKSPSRKLKTSIKKNTVNPVFNETLLYQIDRPQLCSRTLQVSVWHRGTLQRKVFLGEVLVPLKDWEFEDSTTQCAAWYQLCPK
ncbi:Synaptotagmin-like 3-like, partial [Scleropages formosus]